MDALDRLEVIAKDRGWMLLLEYDIDRHAWRMDFGPRENPERVHHIETAVLEDCSFLMMEHVLRLGLCSMAGEKD